MKVNIASMLSGPPAPPAWLLPDVLCKGTRVILAGEPGVGKSLLSYTIAMALATGAPCLNQPGRSPVPVLYFDEENSRPDLHEYLSWVWRGLSCPPVDLLADNLWIEHFSLARQGPAKYRYMAALAAQHRPALIVLDTATPCCGIEDENDNAEASRAIADLTRVQRTAGPECTLLVLKHSRFTHDEEARRTIRGAKTWIGECDATWFHVAVPGRPRKDGLRSTRLEPEKVRAFGLKAPLLLVPHWVEIQGAKGLALTAENNSPAV